MTVSYTIDSRLGAFIHLFARWKGSIFKLVWPDLTIFLVLYFSCSALYRFGLDETQQRLFERVATYCEKYGTLIPVSFVLGFYVSLVIGRWWAQYKIIPWIDTVAIWVSMSVKGLEDEDRLIRRTICRYCVLSITQCFTLISSQAKKRFPTLDHLIVAGLLLENEKTNLENVVACLPKYQTHWIPLVWAANIVSQARIEGKINSDSWMKALIDEINKIKDQCNRLLCFDRIRVPLVYTQVVTLAVYSYFFSCIMGRQWIHIKPKVSEEITSSNITVTARSSGSGSSGKFGVDELDLIVPIFTILQFLFYIGWLKVAGSLVNPFGDDDYDFELNWMIDRHLQVSYSIVDNMHFQNPELIRDPYWGEKVPRELPHTIASLKCNNVPPVTSTSTVIVSNDESEILTPATLLSIHTIAKADIKFRKRNVLAAKKLLLQQMEDNSENQNLTDETGNENSELKIASLTAVENDDSVTDRNSSVLTPDVFSSNTAKKEE